MENQSSHNNNDHEAHFYKGLFFGLILGIGLIWFLNSDTGKDLVKRTRKRIDETLASEPGMEDYEEEENSAESESESKAPASKSHRVFFHKKEE